MREPPILQQTDVTWVLLRGRRLMYFGGSDYLRLSWHPAVRRAMQAGVDQWGPSAGASRMTTGNVPVYGTLERELARFFGMPSATVTSAGYTAPLVAAQAVAPDHTHVVLDARAHACLVDAATLTTLPVTRFAHREVDDLRRAVRACGRKARVLVMTDGLFTHSGEVAPLAEYQAVLPASATLLVDDAHGAGCLGPRGRGTPEWVGAKPRQGMVWTITLSKAFGAYGGVILSSTAVRQAILERSRLFTGNTEVPPPCAEAARAALGVLREEGDARRARLRAHTETLRRRLAEAGPASGAVARRPVDVAALVRERPGPMVVGVPSSAASATRLERALLDAEIFPSLIRYPNGPADRYFRFALSSEHTADQLQRLGDVLVEARRRGTYD